MIKTGHTKETERFFDKYFQNHKQKKVIVKSDFLDGFLLKRYYLSIAAKLIEEIKKIGITKDTRILDIGSGSGDYLIYLNNYFKKGNYFGVDLSQKAIDLAKRNIKKKVLQSVDPFINNTIIDVKAKSFTFIKADAKSLPFEKDSFDLVFIVNVLHHTYEYKKIISEAIRVLKPKGKLIIIDLKGHNKLQKIVIKTFLFILPLGTKKRIFSNGLYLSDKEIPERSDVTVTGVKKTLENNKMEIVEYNNYYFIAWYFILLCHIINKKIFFKIMKPFIQILISLERKLKFLFRRFFECYIFVCVKE